MKLIPQIRFKGFTDDWEERKLLDNVDKVLDYRGKSPTKFGMEWGTEGYLVLSALNVKNGYIDKSVEAKYGDQELFERWMGSNRLEKGDVLFTTEAPLGNVAQVPDDNGYILNQRAVAFKSSKDTDNNFFAQLLRSPIVQNTLNANSSGGTAKGIGMKEFAKLNAHVPKTFEEQQKIGTFFKQLDHTIALHQRKLDLLKEQKKGYLQKMFPKNGAKVPELRFAGFADDWEERKLGEHAKYRRGSFPQPYGNKEWYDGEGAMPFVQVVDVTNKLTLVENTKQKISKLAQSKSVFVPKGTVVVTLQGSIGRVAITQYDSFVDRTLLIFEDYEKETDERFWAYTIQKKFEIEKLKAPGGTIKTITKEALSSFDVHLPQFKEQAKIGSFFKQLDDTIALHQRKLDLLKEQKKGFLQKMFV